MEDVRTTGPHSLSHSYTPPEAADWQMTQDQGLESYPEGGDPGPEAPASGGGLEAEAEGSCLAGAVFLDPGKWLGPTAPKGSVLIL